jgi:DNA-binding GntR family transcriptional regulator
LSAVSRVVLREQFKELILKRILTGAYAPGDRLVETRIAQELGTSQAPVREALRDLELLRFVESAPFKGSRVREVANEELLEIYPVRAALEEVAARGAVAGFDGDVSSLGVELEGMRRAASTGDIHAFVDHDVAFHRRIVEASGNGTLMELWGSLHVDLRTTITLVKRAADLGEVAEAHVPVLEALRGGDPEQAADAVRRHIESFSHWAPDPGDT